MHQPPNAMREFIDQHGAEWVVYAVSTDPNEGASRRYLPNAFQKGWLVFESGHRKLRLAPIPTGWHEQSDEELRALLGEARPTTPTMPNGYRAYGAPEQPAGMRPADRPDDVASRRG